MSYWDIAQMNQSFSLTQREQACAAQELPDGSQAFTWVAEHSLELAASPGWSEAWASAVASGNPDPGRDGAVITDGQILSAVQGMLAAP